MCNLEVLDLQDIMNVMRYMFKRMRTVIVMGLTHQDRLSTLYAQHLRQGPHAGQRGLPLRIQPQQPPSSTSHISFRSVFAEEDEYQRLSADEVLEDEAAMQRQVHAPQEHVDRAPQPSVATTQI